MAARAEPAPWVIVAGGFHQHGGMDRANAALAAYLLDSRPARAPRRPRDRSALASTPARHRHVVPRPRGAPALAERLLARARRARWRAPSSPATPLARVVVNGGNCAWPDINWVHAVHAAWPVQDDGAPWWSRYRTAA